VSIAGRLCAEDCAAAGLDMVAQGAVQDLASAPPLARYGVPKRVEVNPRSVSVSDRSAPDRLSGTGPGG